MNNIIYIILDESGNFGFSDTKPDDLNSGQVFGGIKVNRDNFRNLSLLKERFGDILWQRLEVVE